MSDKNKLFLSTQEWHYTCGDGCCDDYGEKVLVNGEDINVDLLDEPKHVIKKILKHLGYDMEWEELDFDRIDLSACQDDSDD